MKRILITGANSYIGTSFERHLARWPDQYRVDTIDMVDGSWREKSFAGYDIVFHVAGIAHIKETEDNEGLYFRVNRDLAVEIAERAKSENIPHFVFMSSMSVYGMVSGVIDENTQPSPNSAYGKSKLEAEKVIQAMADTAFKVAVLRPPMIYGKGCKGNYQHLARFARSFPVFPLVQNKRSMLFIGNLVLFLQWLIDTQESGLFLPQNSQYVNTSEMVKEIAKVHHHPLRLTRVFNPLLRLLPLELFKKVFSDLYYADDIAYSIGTVPFGDSILLTESADAA